MLCGNDSVLLSPQSQNEEAIVKALALSCNSAQFLSCWSALPTRFPNPETAAGGTSVHTPRLDCALNWAHKLYTTFMFILYDNLSKTKVCVFRNVQFVLK